MCWYIHCLHQWRLCCTDENGKNRETTKTFAPANTSWLSEFFRVWREGIVRDCQKTTAPLLKKTVARQLSIVQLINSKTLILVSWLRVKYLCVVRNCLLFWESILLIVFLDLLHHHQLLERSLVEPWGHRLWEQFLLSLPLQLLQRWQLLSSLSHGLHLMLIETCGHLQDLRQSEHCVVVCDWRKWRVFVFFFDFAFFPKFNPEHEHF